MLLLVKKYRKGVSPVIAVVLLIALTVAAAAVIWTLTSGILDNAQTKGVTIKVSASSANGAAGNITLTLTINSDDVGKINDLIILSAPSGVTGGTADVQNPSLIKGSQARTIVIYGITGLVGAQGSYKFQLNYDFGGSPLTQDFEVSLSPA